MKVLVVRKSCSSTEAGKLPAAQKVLFGYSNAPGSVVKLNEKDVFQETLVDQHFGWVIIRVESIDALHLGRLGTMQELNLTIKVNYKWI